LDNLLVVARFVHYAAAIQLFGGALFYLFVIPGGLRPALREPIRILEIVGAVLALLSGIAWLMATAAAMGDGPQDGLNPDVIGTVLAQTEFGHVWGPRLALCALAVIVAFPTGDWARWVGLVLSTLVLGSLGLVGHATIDSGVLGALNETSQALHLLSSGFWLGALVPVLYLLALFRRSGLEPLADLALRRFSGTGHLAVAVLLLSGVANTWFILGDKADLAAPYQQLLLVKIGIAGMMCVLAIVNRYVFMPRIPNGGPGARELARGTIAEIVLGASILALVALIGILAPA
jgi:putative copper resistance protein D